MAEKDKEIEIYFGGSIRGGRRDAKIYTEITKLLGNYGTVLTEHIGDQNLTSSGESLEDPEIFERDLGWLRRSKKRVFEVTNPSFGVGYETGKADVEPDSTLLIWRKRKDRRLSAMANGNPNVWKTEYKRVKDLIPVFNAFFGKIDLKPQVNNEQE